MSTKIKIEKNGEHKQKTWYQILIKGAMVWGIAYSMAITGAAYALTVVMGKNSAAMSGIFLKSMVIFAPLGAICELLKWRLFQQNKTSEKLFVITNQNTETESSCSIHQKAA